MTTAKLKLTAWVVASVGLVAMAGVGTVSAWPRSGVPVAALVKLELPLEVAAPVPPEAPIEGDWIPKKSTDKAATAFASITSTGALDLKKTCPKLFGENAFPIEATDDTYRRLLKAQLHQGVQHIQLFQSRIQRGVFSSQDQDAYLRALESARVPTIELWEKDPKNLVPRLEEFLILARDAERFTKARVDAGTDAPSQWHSAQRHRLEVEAALWKAIHPKPAGK